MLSNGKTLVKDKKGIYKRRMDMKKEYASLIAGAKRHVELFYHAGVYDFALPPRSADCSDRWAVKEGGPSACPEHGGFGGWSLALWRVGGLVIAYGFPVSQDKPVLGTEEAGQMEKILAWLASQINGEQGSITISVYRCAEAGVDQDGLKAALPLAEEKLKAFSPKAVVLMGSVAAGLLTGKNINDNAGRLRGRLLDMLGIKAAATWGIDELVKDPDLKKQAFGDFKMALSAIL